ncbi:sigma-54-dependent transcriptional regulator [Adhaeribacter radiodurans]|uniref:Sigma-54-dependent Fis family transcriptional regulator n=1 Tax=Adhaeribacter radiodurans TaxID=2745197 RepID=A0A7L7LBB2_9BACT|nr:sigma-54 dependent transcriptional regulator [Adhaeribacter radiodurans]QMU30043.1 sigma-54-dependent Fis family transcriptional regulator [Adhaeribacter radiodurans]
MILIIDDDVAVRTSLGLLLKQAKYQTVSAAGAKSALYVLHQSQPIDLIILDMNFSMDTSGQDGLELLVKIKELNPQIPVILITGWGSIALAVEGMKAGAFDFVSKPWNNEHLLQTIHTALHLNKTTPEPDNSNLNRKQLNQQYQFANIIGEDSALIQILRQIGQISATDASVLIEGESGTGKELIAEAIHQNSLRKNQNFVKVNLGGISSSLFESEMFGHKKGAFTDAKGDRVGRFELANKGSIFLDEIGELDLSSQVKLLRVLQDRTYEVLGDSKPRQLDIRVICATNRDLAEMVAQGKFREDLFYRINLITVKLPALRERPQDIPLLVKHFLQNLQKTYHRPSLQISETALRYLAQQPLPGNIRELKNLVERTVLVSGKDYLDIADFQGQQPRNLKKAENQVMTGLGMMTLEEMEAVLIRQSMEQHKGNISKVAKSLGLSRGALYRRLEKFDIPYDAAD